MTRVPEQNGVFIKHTINTMQSTILNAYRYTVYTLRGRLQLKLYSGVTDGQYQLLL